MDGAARREPALTTVRRGLALSPEFRRGLGGTLLLAVVATAGRVAVPIAVQQVIDRGLRAPGGADLAFVRLAVGACAAAVVATALAAYAMNVRLYRAGEAGLATLRVKGFRRVHELSTLTQDRERRGSLVSRVTSDVDQVSMFIQHGGLLMLVTGGQLVVASALMLVYSWQLALLVWACFLPFALVLPRLQRRLSAAYSVVRERLGDMLAGVSESVVGAGVIRAYGVEDRTGRRVDAAIDRHRRAQVRAQRVAVLTFSSSEVVAAAATAGVVALGVYLGVDGGITAGRVVAFLFIITLFIAPMQVATEVLNEAQRAVAGWRRVLEVLDTAPDVVDPAERGVDLPRGAIGARFEGVSFGYPGGPRVLHDVCETVEPGSRVAVVGETGSGKTTFAKLLTRLMDPDEGHVLVGGVPLPEVRFSSLRERVVLVPQEGFLFDATVAGNVRYGRPEASDERLMLAFTELGLAEWVESLPRGLHTPVGQRGESLSEGERQLVALARAYLADPDMLVLDEATSAVDPATELRLQRTLQSVTRGRTSVSVAHRLSTAEAADEVLVFDGGRVVQRGPHAELLREGGVYGALYASWSAQDAYRMDTDGEHPARTTVGTAGRRGERTREDSEDTGVGMADEKPSADELDLSGVVWRRGAPDDADDADDADADGDTEEGDGRIEVAFLEDGTTLMRDGEDPESPVLVFTPQEWEAFVGGVKDGEFDLSETHPGLWKDEEPDQEGQG